MIDIKYNITEIIKDISKKFVELLIETGRYNFLTYEEIFDFYRVYEHMVLREITFGLLYEDIKRKLNCRGE